MLLTSRYKAPKEYAADGLPRLIDAIIASGKATEKYRTGAVDHVRRYAGADYSEDNETQPLDPLNLLALYVDIFVSRLVSKNPRTMLQVFNRQHRAVVKSMQDWQNLEFEKIDFASALQRTILDALFRIGTMKVALTTPSDSAMHGWQLPAGRAFLKSINLEDFRYDPHCRDITEAGWTAHFYRVPLETVKDDGMLYSKARKDLEADEDRQFDTDGAEKLSSLARGSMGHQRDEFEDHITLCEVWLPRKKQILTLAKAQIEDGELSKPMDEPLRVQRWVGPDCGPYHFLGFGRVPNNAMYKGTVPDLVPLHDQANNILRKLLEQGNDQKTVIPYRGGNEADAKRLQETADRGLFRCDGDPPKPIRFGGPDQQNLALLTQIIQWFSRQAGNLDALGGLGVQAPTATQEEMISATAGGLVTSMQGTVQKFITSVASAHLWYAWHHPSLIAEVNPRVDGVPDGLVEDVVEPERRWQVPFESIGIKIVPYSYQSQTPQARMQFMSGLLKEIQPWLPMLQANGYMIDWHYWLTTMGELGDTPDVQNLFTVTEPVPMDAASSGGAPANTTRTYERVSRSQRTQEGTDKNLITSLMGIDPGGASTTGQAPAGSY